MKYKKYLNEESGWVPTDTGVYSDKKLMNMIKSLTDYIGRDVEKALGVSVVLFENIRSQRVAQEINRIWKLERY